MNVMKGMHKMAFLKKIDNCYFLCVYFKYMCGSIDMKVGNSSLKGEIEEACCTKKQIMFLKVQFFTLV